MLGPAATPPSPSLLPQLAPLHHQVGLLTSHTLDLQSTRDYLELLRDILVLHADLLGFCDFNRRVSVYLFCFLTVLIKT